MFGSTEVIVILLIVFVLFGASAIPRFARSIGQAKKEFEGGLKDAEQSKQSGEEITDSVESQK